MNSLLVITLLAVHLTTSTGDPVDSRYAKIAAQSLAPTPPVTVTVVNDNERCPDQDCAWWQQQGDNPPTYYISMVKNGPHLREDFLHELGHIFDYAVLTNSDRRQFKRIIRRHRNASELFADAYALCATKRRIHRLRVSVGTYGYLPTPRQHRKVCRLIRSASSRSSLLGDMSDNPAN